MFHRIRDAVRELARGKASYNERANYAAERVWPLRPADFPLVHQQTVARLLELREKATWHGPVRPLLKMSLLSYRERREFAEGLLAIYEDMVAARARSSR